MEPSCLSHWVSQLDLYHVRILYHETALFAYMSWTGSAPGFGMKCHFTYKAWVKCRLWQGRETAGRQSIPSPTAAPSYQSHFLPSFREPSPGSLSLPMSPVVLHCRSSGMAAEVREWVTCEGGEEAAAAIPDSLTRGDSCLSHPSRRWRMDITLS